MHELLKLTPQDRRFLFQITAKSMAVDPLVIEKDFWVVVVLQALFQNEAPASFVFKGGTSLSKAFSLIERFSEDIDITIDRKSLGFSLSNDEMSTLSRNAKDRLLKEMQQKCVGFVGKELASFLQGSLDNLIKEPFKIQQSEFDGQSLLFYYPTLESQTSYVAQHVYIECGIRGSMEPAEEAPIKPYVSKIMETKPIQVRALSPLRTFWEKATLLHAEAHRPDEKDTPIRLSRHYYDLFMFERSPYSKAAMLDTALLKDVIHHKISLFPCAWARYETILENGIKLVPDDKRLREIKVDYEQTKIMLFNSTPEFKNILNKIKEMEDFINTSLKESIATC
jgi:hypothetical protein